MLFWSPDRRAGLQDRLFMMLEHFRDTAFHIIIILTGRAGDIDNLDMAATIAGEPRPAPRPHFLTFLHPLLTQLLNPSPVPRAQTSYVITLSACVLSGVGGRLERMRGELNRHTHTPPTP